MIDYTNCNIENLSVHQIGNKTNGENLLLSKNVLDISDLRLRELLLKFFLSSFSESEFYSFSFTNEDFTLNPLYNYSSQVFDSAKSFHRNTTNIAKHLFEVSIHPQIKSGDLFVCYFSGINCDGEIIDALGIFKSENRQPFLKLSSEQNGFALNYDDGINIEKLDKGCLILNTERGNGFKISIVDKSNKNIEAQFWKDSFLMLRLNKGLEKLFGHSFIKHNEKEYVRGEVHTNTMEGFWSLLSRGVMGIYHSWSNKHLQKYLDEFVFRYNTRKLTEGDRFNLMLSGLANHLPYSKLIEDEKKQPIKWFDTIAVDRTARYQQGSFGF